MFPLVPVAVMSALGGLGYLLFKPDAPVSGGSTPSPSQSPTPSPTPSQSQGSPTQMPWVKRPADLPPPVPPVSGPIPIPIPMPNVSPVQPVPAPQPQPMPQPLPSIPDILRQLPLPPMPPAPTPIQPTDQTGVVVAPSGLNLRNGPSTSSARLTGLVAGTRVKILRYDPSPTDGAPKGWYQVTAPNGQTGYLTAEFVLPDNGSNPVPVPIPIPVPGPLPNILPNILPSIGVTTGRILGNPGANMRSSPSTSGGLVKGLFNGTIVTVLSTTLAPASTGAPQGWVNVRDSSGASGWVSRQYCEPVSGSPFGADHSFSDVSRNSYRKKSRIRG